MLAYYASIANLEHCCKEEQLKSSDLPIEQVLVDCLQEWAPAKVVTRLLTFFKVQYTAHFVK